MNDTATTPASPTAPATSRPNTPIPGYTPELHNLWAKDGILTVPGNDGAVRTYLCLDLEEWKDCSLYCSYDPALEEELVIFVWRDLTKFATGQHVAPSAGGFQYVGTGSLASTHYAGKTANKMTRPEDLEPDNWQPMATLVRYDLAYLRDNAGRMALGYHDGHPEHSFNLKDVIVVTGPKADFTPIEWQSANYAMGKGGQH